MIKVTENNIHIEGSCDISKRAFKDFLQGIEAAYPDCEVIKARSLFSLQMEWAVHNALYKLGLWKERTRDVDLDYPSDRPEWLYCVLGVLVWPFIP